MNTNTSDLTSNLSDKAYAQGIMNTSDERENRITFTQNLFNPERRPRETREAYKARRLQARTELRILTKPHLPGVTPVFYHNTSLKGTHRNITKRVEKAQRILAKNNTRAEYRKLKAEKKALINSAVFDTVQQIQGLF